MQYSYADDNLVWSARLVRDEPDDETDAGATAALMTAVDALTSGWAAPLVVTFNIECCDPSNFFEESHIGPATRLWALQVQALPEAVDTRDGSGRALEPVQSADRTTVADAISRALAQPCPSTGLVTSLTELHWEAVRVRVPPTPSGLTLRSDYGELVTVLQHRDGATWALGPLHTQCVGPPFHLTAYNSPGVTEIRIGMYWDLWATHPEGRAMIETGFERVRALDRNWSIETSSHQVESGPWATR